MQKPMDAFASELKSATDYLATSRPTAVNLFWALNRITQTAQKNRHLQVSELKGVLLSEALEIIDEDRGDVSRHRATRHGIAK